MRRRPPLFAIMGLVLACDSNAPPVVGSVEVTPASQTLTALGQTLAFSAVVKDQDGHVLSGRSISWRAAAPNVATIDATTGLATAVANGLTQIIATADGISGATLLTVAQVSTRLTFLAPPQGGTAGRAFSPVVKVEIEDAGGARVATASDMVTVMIGMNPGGASLAGTPTVAAASGVATFSGISLDKAAAGYTLVATSGMLTGSTTAPFTIVPSHGPFSQLALGFFHSCGINGSGAVYCWGANTSDQLGDGTTISRPHPEPVSGGHVFTAIVAGSNHTCGIVAGAMYCWGSNSFGQLGDGSKTDRSSPTLVAGNHTFIAVTAGFYHTCGLVSGGAAYCWGYNSKGQLGDGSVTDHSIPTAVMGSLTFSAVSAGGSHSCGMTGTGAAYCWGDNSSGQLGDGTSVPEQDSPELIADTINFASLVAGEFHSCGTIAAGTAYCWGGNSTGAVGDGTNMNSRLSPAVVSGVTLGSVTAAGMHSCGLDLSHAPYCWGYNAFGQLGDGTQTDRPNATPVPGGLSFNTITAGPTHTCALTAAGAAYCWGDNLTGQLGDGTTVPRFAPTAVEP